MLGFEWQSRLEKLLGFADEDIAHACNNSAEKLVTGKRNRDETSARNLCRKRLFVNNFRQGCGRRCLCSTASSSSTTIQP